MIKKPKPRSTVSPSRRGEGSARKGKSMLKPMGTVSRQNKTPIKYGKR
jgi:hypothetical protein